MALRLMTAALCAGLASGALSSDAQDLEFPAVTGYSLDGTEVSVPFGTGDSERLVILAFGDWDAPGVAAWESRLRALAPAAGRVPVQTFVIMGDASRFARAARAGRLRAKVETPALRARIVPVFETAETFLVGLDLSGRSEVAAVLVRGGDDVVWRQEGPPTDEALSGLRAILAGAPPESMPAPPGPTADARPDQPASPAPETVRPAIVAPTTAETTLPPSDDEQAEPPQPEAETPNPIPDEPYESAGPGSVQKTAIPAQPPGQAEVRPASPSEEDSPAMRLPPLSGFDLEGRRVELPASLSEGRTLLLMRTSIDAPIANLDWRAVASETGHADTHLLSLVILRDRGFGRAMMSGRVRARISDPDHRRTTVPIFVSNAEHGSLPVDMGADGFVALIVESTGRVLEVLDDVPDVEAGGAIDIGHARSEQTSDR